MNEIKVAYNADENRIYMYFGGYQTHLDLNEHYRTIQNQIGHQILQTLMGDKAYFKWMEESQTS